ncbi:MAG: toprim domain-containing protein, partial [Clostridia bacterium]|nr:toprim domain-containing protein [Clostridia bacterium]
LYEINREAGRFFYRALLSPQGENARAYLVKRQFSSATVKMFGIGYAPKSGYNEAPLCDHLISLGFTPAEIITANLGRENKNGRLYDVFRNRLMFPVADVSGELVAFSGRRLNEEDDKKYINTAETPVFKKGRILFALNLAKNSKSGSFIMCEGAPDAIAMHQAGFGNAVATLGTAITPEHARIIAKYVRTVYLAYDIDKAGRNATLKGIDMLNQVGVDTKIINLGTETKDPDEFIKKFGAEAFRAKLTGSTGQIDYSIDEIISRYDITVAEEKLRAAGEVTKYIANLASRPEREVYSERAAVKLGLTPESLRSEVERTVRKSARKASGDYAKKVLERQSGFGDTPNTDKLRFSSEASHEEAILGILLVRSDLGPLAASALTENDFATALNKKIFSLFREDFAEGREAVLSKDGALTPREVGALESCRAARLALGDNSEDALRSHIKALKDLRERADYDKKIESDPSGGLKEYLESLKNKGTDNITEGQNGKRS